MLRNLFIGLAAAIVIILALGFILPDKAHVERSAVIEAPPEAIYAIASDLNQQDKWSPWLEHDPATQSVVTGEGVGQTMTWTSKKMGNGSQTITALEPPTRIVSHLDFGDMGLAEATMTITPSGAGSAVTWTLDSNMREGVPLWMKPLSTYLGFFMDGMVGKDYERGLEKLKAAAEAI
jgi:uncharacterized protein YndB with AHSA1/START domain